jgi:hypothetical protein
MYVLRRKLGWVLSASTRGERPRPVYRVGSARELAGGEAPEQDQTRYRKVIGVWTLPKPAAMEASVRRTRLTRDRGFA